MRTRTQIGRIVRLSDGTKELRPRLGGRHGPSSFTVVQPSGVQRLPREWVPDGAGDWLVKGDLVVIEYLDDNPRRPIVTGTVRTFQDTSGLARVPSDDPGRDFIRALLDFTSTEGVSPGTVDLKVGEDGKVRVELELSELAALLNLTLEQGKLTVKGKEAASVEPLCKDAVLDVLDTVITDLAAVATVAGTAVPSSLAKQVEVAADRAASTGTYTTTTLEAE